MENGKKSSGLALIPFLVFIVIYLGAGIILQSRGVDMAFYQFPAVVAMFIAVLVAFAINYKAGINENFKIFARGAGSEDIMCMLMIFLLAFFAILSYFVPAFEKLTLKGRWDWKENKVVNE